MNASKYSCDALIVFVDKDPIHISLPVTQKYVQVLSSKLRALAGPADRQDGSIDLIYLLRELWERVVSHIINLLQTICPPNSHIWWCPTAEFFLLPLHPTSPYRKDQKGASYFFISSYTTTFAPLVHARRPSPPAAANEKKRILAIGQAGVKGELKLVRAGPELTKIRQLVRGLATFTRIQGEEACIPNVVGELGKSDWVHFACHGAPDEQWPFESAFALYDDLFTIQQTIQCNLENPEFAYLSACHTTVGDQVSPDEAIHLASAMQFAGFRSVIGPRGSD